MARLTFPSDRLVYSSSSYAGSAFKSAVGSTATVYSDANGTTLADVQNIDGTANPTATFTVDSTSRLPLFLGPASGADTLYVKIGTGPVTAIYAVTSGDISAAVGTEVTNRTAADAAHVAASDPHGDRAAATAADAAHVAASDPHGDRAAATAALTAHTSNTSNPHAVTASQVGAENVVVHGATAGTARPTGATVVHWIGSVAPTNAATNDEWTDTTNKILKRWNGTAFDSLGSAASASFADKGAWASSTAYVVGDFVTVNGVKYVCKTAHTSGGTFSGAGTNWTITGEQPVAGTLASRPAATGSQAAYLVTDNNTLYVDTAAGTWTQAGETPGSAVNSRLIQQYGSANGLPQQPWAPAPTVGPNLWSLANFSSFTNGADGTVQTASLTPAITNPSGNTWITTRMNLPQGTNGTGKWRLTFDVTTTGTMGGLSYGVNVKFKDHVGGTTSGTNYWNPFGGSSTNVTNLRIVQEYDIAVLSTGVGEEYYCDVILYALGGSATGSIQISNVKFYPITHVLPSMRVSWDRTPAPGAQIFVDQQFGPDEGGNLRRVRRTFGIENGDSNSLYYIAATAYYEAAMQSPESVTSPIFTQYPSGQLHINNDVDVINVKKADLTFELRGNTHGGETSQTGVYTTDYQLWVDYSDGNGWQQVTTYNGGWFRCWRAKIVANTKITRSDQSTPFVLVSRTYYAYADGTLRCDKTMTFQQAQVIKDWFWHMTSQAVTSGQEPYQGKIGRGTEVLGTVDYGVTLAAPALSAAPSVVGTGGTLGAGSYSVKVTALNALGETTSSFANGGVTISTGTTNSLSVSWGAVTGASGYAIYFGSGGNEMRIATTASTSYTITGSEIPSGRMVPTKNTAYTTATKSMMSANGYAEWTAIREPGSGFVYSLSLDRDAALAMSGVAAIRQVLVRQDGSITKNYWQLAFTTDQPTIANGAVYSGTVWYFVYYPSDSVNYEKEQTLRAGSTKYLNAIYPTA